MDSQTASDHLRRLFQEHTVVDLPTIRAALGGVCAMTAFRHLRHMPYRRSYNCNGRFYALHEPSRYDRFGLWSGGDGVHFSIHGSLRKTVRRLIEEADAGATHQELQQLLHVRVHNTLLDLLRHGEVARDRRWRVYVYCHVATDVRSAQLAQRRERIDKGRVSAGEVVDDAVVIEVLLTLLRHRGAGPAEVVRHLRGRSPPIWIEQVRAVFARYALDRIGEKGGTTRS